MLVKVQLHGPTITDDPSPRKTEIDFRKRLVPEETYVKLEGFIWVQSYDLPEQAPIPLAGCPDYKMSGVIVQTEDRKKTYKAFGLWTTGEPGVVCIDVLRRMKIEGEEECSS